ncbi:rhomboid family intramembrane serine protease [Blastopirellula sp. JC732]|uniref:Rhomboid family intramembrane serine protease n=1 Tax=Blastopirellula sediminis TaxID=2894196 RepID=A0A9X1SK99_9BACT|nr:rhomboid family intramembrane serine protease [Blastopirellula sediminis]MCC9607188.1 rhomboid family intramembrane serine protease [Blastopirellula sediminis]MCC9629519.1 rhomboid family intramembrane serine protease [Blastopirellula sediminis]
MGIYDREYYQDEPRSLNFSLGGRSIVNTLVIINVIVFFVDFIFFGGRLAASSFDPRIGGDVGGWAACHSDTLLHPLLWWQFLTYGFLHSPTDIFHIIGNMFVLWMFGRQIEDRYGSAEFLRIYLLSVVLGGVLWSAIALATGSAGTVVGASGAVTTILILFICNFPRVTIYFQLLIPIPAWLLGVIIIGMNVLGAFGNGQSNVAFTVHLAGAALGLAYFYGGWNFGYLSFGGLPDRIRQSMKRKPNLKVHTPPDEDPYLDSNDEAEQVLDKVRDHGLDSLTPAEKRKLEAYSRRMKQKHS